MFLEVGDGFGLAPIEVCLDLVDGYTIAAYWKGKNSVRFAMFAGLPDVAISSGWLMHSPIEILAGRMGVHEADKRNLFALAS